MTTDLSQFVLYLIIVLLLVKPLGWHMANVFEGKKCGLEPLLGPVERFIYKIAGIKPEDEMGWRRYLVAMLLANLCGLLFVYGIQRLQAYLPLNPQSFP